MVPTKISKVVCVPGPKSQEDWDALMRRRRDFGQLLRRHRESLGLSAIDLAAKTKLASTVISNLECGQRQAGPDVAERLLRVLNLTDEKRQEFLVAALRSTFSEVLPQHAKRFDPELFRLLWGKLDVLGVSQERITSITSSVPVNKKSPEVVRNAASLLAQSLEEKATAIRNALASENVFYHIGMVANLVDGAVLLMELNATKAGAPKAGQ